MPEDTQERATFQPKFVLSAQGIAWLIVLSALVFALSPPDIDVLILAGLLSLPYLVFGAMPRNETSTAWGRAIAWIGIVFGLAALGWIPALACIFLATQIAMLVLLHRTTARAFPRALLINAGYYVLVAVLVLWNVGQIYDTSPLPSNESSAIASLRTINTAAITYANAYDKTGFPPDLHSLGPASAAGREGSSAAGMLEAVLACAQPPCVKRGYRIEYHLLGKDFYWAGARPVKFQKTGIRSFFTDQTGVIRFTREDRAATAKDSPLE